MDVVLTRVVPLSKKDKPTWRWWIFAAVLLLSFIVLQLPAAWILARVSPNNPFLENVSGNIWHGQGDWHYQNVQGVVSWQVRPWMLLLLRVSADVEIQTGDTHLQGIITHSAHRFELKGVSGQVDAGTLQTLLPWQWPSAPVLFKDVSLVKHDKTGFSDISGQLNWGGGVLGYPFEGHTERATLPVLRGELSQDKDRLHLAMTNEQKERMGDFYLAGNSASLKEAMIDVQLTQRLLINVSGYKGQAGLDTAVISLRQPLSTLGAM